MNVNNNSMPNLYGVHTFANGPTTHANEVIEALCQLNPSSEEETVLYEPKTLSSETSKNSIISLDEESSVVYDIQPSGEVDKKRKSETLIDEGRKKKKVAAEHLTIETEPSHDILAVSELASDGSSDNEDEAFEVERSYAEAVFLSSYDNEQEAVISEDSLESSSEAAEVSEYIPEESEESDFPDPSEEEIKDFELDPSKIHYVSEASDEDIIPDDQTYTPSE